MSLHNAKSILIFNRLKRFTAFCPSLNYAAALLGVSSSLVSDACHGRNGSIQAKGYYVRFGGGWRILKPLKWGLLNLTVHTGLTPAIIQLQTSTEKI